MADVDPRLASALAIQFERWRTTLGAGARRVGWKLGMGERESMGSGSVIGHLTTATQIEAGAVFRAQGAGALHADAEVGLMLGRDVGPEADCVTACDAIAGYGAALEFVDLESSPEIRRASWPQTSFTEPSSLVRWIAGPRQLAASTLD